MHNIKSSMDGTLKETNKALEHALTGKKPTVSKDKKTEKKIPDRKSRH